MPLRKSRPSLDRLKRTFVTARRGMRVQLMLVLLVATVPLMLAKYASFRDEQAQLLDSAQSKAVNLARTGVSNSIDVIDEARTALDILAQVPILMAGSSAECSELLQRVVRTRPWASGIYALDRDGTVVCSSSSLQMGLNVADRNYVRKAIENRAFFAGDFILGRISRQPIVGSALPIFDQSGNLSRIFVASISVTWLNKLTQDILAANPNSKVTLIDGAGIVLADASGNSGAVGKPLASDDMRRKLAAATGDFMMATAEDSKEMIFGISGLPHTRARLLVGLSRDNVLKDLSLLRRAALLEVALLCLAMFSLIWFYIRSAVIRPVEALLAHANGVGAGRLNARLDGSQWPWELGALARSLNGMTVRLQRHATKQAVAREDLLQQSLTDPLTGISNRRDFDRQLGLRFASAQTRQSPIAIVIADADHFKAFNDTYGHGEGDKALCTVADVLRKVAEAAGGAAARIGGEEFALLLPGHDEAMALAVADRALVDMAQRSIRHARSDAGVMTLSLGVAATTPLGASQSAHTMLPAALMAAADAALYLAKSSGRNRAMGASRMASAVLSTRIEPSPGRRASRLN